VVSPDPDDPAFAAAADRYDELTPYEDGRPPGPDTDLGWIGDVAAADPAVVAACPAVTDAPYLCSAASVAFATQADAERFVELYADPVHGPFAGSTGSVD